MELESIIMELVVNSGEARNNALEAIDAAQKQNYELAETKLNECEAALSKAHAFQTKLLSQEAGGESQTPISLILIHGQDHLMNAMTVRDLARYMIQMCHLIYEKGNGN